MIFEMRTYLLRPGTVAEAERRFEKALPHRLQFSKLAGFWHTQSGLLNQIIHIWPYESIQHRMTARAEAVKTGEWPPKLRDLLLDMESRIVVPAAFSPPLEPHNYGRCYEICIDSHLPGGPDLVAANWNEAITHRTALSPLVVCGRTEIGPLNQWIHIWAYEDVADRERVANILAKDGSWPPAQSCEKLVRQESLLVAPASFSALK
ncbi:NIPSNAP family protein [Burkholderia pseudomallei]|nr:NIPSNAP family protein [Burkholderia pseudomallei]